MFRPILCLAAAALLGQGFAADLKSTLNARYQQLNAALKRNDSQAVEKWLKQNLTSDFKYTSKDGHSFGREAFAKGLKEQVQQTKQVLISTVQLSQFGQSKQSASVFVKSDFKGKVNFDGRELTLVDHSQTSDTWVKVGTDWKLDRSIQTKDDTQMFEH
jgi:hypothetical protein